MKITTLSDPICNIPFLNAGRGPGGFYVDQLPFHLGEVAALPEDLDAIIATADLQGRERFEEGQGRPPRLLGEWLPRHLVCELLPELGVDPQKVGVVLAGDFYTVPGLDKRGGSGDVTKVWQAFAEAFKWVAGVAGNHDTFSDSIEPQQRLAPNAHYLDGAFATLTDLNVAGIGGIIGNPRKPHRKTDEQFVGLVEKLSFEPIDILVMHDGPNATEARLRGSPRIREALESASFPLIVRGHAHWSKPLIELANGSQVLNVDCRVALLRRANSNGIG